MVFLERHFEIRKLFPIHDFFLEKRIRARIRTMKFKRTWITDNYRLNEPKCVQSNLPSHIAPPLIPRAETALISSNNR
uniref:Uncharacterized protein n=1 Tax=Candidatus Kentrum sp. TC TaxID=2126339 RepID=A0A450ZE36_9GAMM|nr:MAG: hypothetical protein BECKTC1821D_GA0114238_11526 [Candidatus Kentron sp. TC]